MTDIERVKYRERVGCGDCHTFHEGQPPFPCQCTCHREIADSRKEALANETS